METTPIIIVKRPRRHVKQHGGAWKVAYADFVTAMMALFIVLWLLSSSEQVQKAVGGYFTDPSGQGKELGNGCGALEARALPFVRATCRNSKRNSTKPLNRPLRCKKSRNTSS